MSHGKYARLLPRGCEDEGQDQQENPYAAPNLFREKMNNIFRGRTADCTA